MGGFYRKVIAVVTINSVFILLVPKGDLHYIDIPYNLEFQVYKFEGVLYPSALHVLYYRSNQLPLFHENNVQRHQ